MKKIILLSTLSLLFFLKANSQVVDPFSIRYQNQQKGGIAMLSNVSVSCTNCNTTIAQVPPSGNGINNSFTMSYVDIDGNASTFMSSSDSLNLSNCSEILWAGLYWSARVSTGGTPTTTTNYTTRNQIKLKANNGAYQTLTADELLDNSTGHQTYHCFKNITSIVQNNGIKARYTVADLVTRTGVSAVYGGWTIVVVYKNVYESMRNLTVFDGLANVSTGNSVTIPINGFVTPLAGPVNFELGVVSHDGDRGDVGDQLLFNGAGSFVNVSDAAHNANDVFNSSIADNGVLTPFRNPSLNNTLGHDASIFKPVNTSLNYIGNNTNSANIQITTGGETILTSVVTSVIDVFEPDLRATVYISDINGGLVNPGDELEYTVVGKNIGSDISLGTFITDTLDPRTVYVPNSLSITYGQNAGTKTDAFSDDQAEYDPVNKVVIARIGTGANGSTGGSVTNSPTGADSTVLKFRVTVIDDCLMFQCDQTLEHKAYIFGTGNISGNSYNNNGLSDLYDANGCPIIASDILSINVTACPISAITYNSPICVGETIQFALPFSPNANYTWTGPSGFNSSIYNPSITNASATNQGTYNVEITFDGLNCMIDTFATVTVNTPPSIQLNSITNVNCFNGNTGAISTTASGNGPFTYAWSNGNTTANPTGLPAGNYTLTVSNAATCTATQSYTVTQNSQLVGSTQNLSNYNGFNVSCFANASDGSTKVQVSGGTPGYTYLWNNGMTNDTIMNLPAGNYSVVVTDALGCTLNLSTTLTKPTKLESSISSVNVQCFGESNGTATVNLTGGVAPYTYLWENGAQTAQISNLGAGQYIANGFDANLCAIQDTVNILAPLAPLTFSANVLDVLCTGQNTGAIYVSPFGGTVPWTFNWSNGATTQDLENVAAGTYSLTLSDANGCTFTDSYTITQPLSPISATASIQDVSCFGFPDGTIDISPSGGTGGYTYVWNNSIAAQDLVNYPANTYSVTITDANNCAISINNLVISQPAAALQTILTPTAVNCFGENTGAISQSTNGGTAPYTYSWNTGATSLNLSGISAGVYTVNVTDLNGCITSATTTITQPVAPIQLSESHVDVLCFGDLTGSIDISSIGGTAPYTFAWSTGQTTEDLNAISSGIYSLTVTDQLGCDEVISVTVQQPLQPLTLSETHTDALCIGAQQGTIDLQVSGGTSPYSYSWNNASTNEDQINLLAGQYTVLVTDNHNCQASLNVEILDPSNTTVLSEIHTNVACFTESTGTIDLLVTGGVAPHTFAWTNGATTEDISNLPAGNYAVNVLDLNGCGEFLSVLITEPSTAVSATIAHTDVLCNGYNTGSMEVTPNGGVGPYTFSWNNGETNALISNLTAGSYTVTVTDNNGCNFTFSDAISEPANPVVITENITNVNCFGENTGEIQIEVAGGTAPYNYAWNTGTSTSSIASLIAGSYILTVTDQNNCVYSETYQITQPTAPLATSNSIATVSCFGGADGSIDLTVTGGTTPYTFAWSNGQTTEDLANLSTGSHSVVVTDAQGCTISTSATVSQPSAPLSIAFSQTNVLCYEAETGAINITVSGGTPTYSFVWSTGLQTEDIDNLADGTYSVTVEDARGCLVNQTVEITQPTAPLNATSTQVNVACFGEATGNINASVTGGTTPYTYAWSSGQTTEDLSSIPVGTYNLEITDLNGCVFMLSNIQVTQPSAPLSDAFVSTPVACFGESTGSISTTISGGTTPYAYAWSTGATINQITNQPAGNYTLTVTDHQGCILTNSYTITQPTAALGLDLSMNPVICYGESNGNVSASVTGGTTPYNYAWNSGQSTASVTNLPAGNYALTVTDFNSCIIDGSIEITQPDALAIQLSAVDVLCHGLATGSTAVDATGGQGTYTYSWSNGETTASISNLVAGTYTVTVTDENNCSFTNSIDVNQPTAPISFDFSTTDNICFGGTSGSASVAISGGTAPYTSGWSNMISSLTNPNLPAGVYLFQTTDANNCVLIDSIEIFEPTQITIIDSSHTDISCFDFTDGTIQFTTIGGTPNYSYTWSNGATTEDLSNLADGTYTVQITDANNCQRSFNFQLTEPEVLVATTTMDEPSCFGYDDGSIFSNVMGGTLPYTYSWSNGASTADNTSIPTGTYDLTVTDNNNCVVQVTTELTQPAQIQVSFDANILEGCDPLEVKLTNTSLEQHMSDWTFGDGNSGNGTQIEHTFTGEGCYDITLEITDINGCSNSVTYTDFICVLETPDAEIGITNIELGVPYPETNITNLSTDSDSYSWNLGGSIDYDYFEPGDVSFPAYVVDQFLITLVAYNDNGCVDSAVRIIYFDNSLIMYVPNTFTPNGDEFNQVFQPVFAEQVTAYNLKIFNRWGEMIFESNDTNLGWDGTYNGVLVQDGTYTWDIWVNTYDAHIYRKQGVVNVLK